MAQLIIEKVFGTALGVALRNAGASDKVFRKTVADVAGQLSILDNDFNFESFVAYAEDKHD